MARGILIGVDLGTTVLKVCAFDASTGAVRAKTSERIPVSVTRDGGREQSLRSVDAALRRAMRVMRSSLATDFSRVQGIGIAAQGGSSIIVDRDTGQALTPMILWNDARGAAFVDRVLQRFPRDYWRRLALRDFAPAGLCRLVWLRERQPELFTASNIHVGAGEYLFHRLTGIWRQDPGHAIQIGAYDAANYRLDSEPLELIDMPLSFVAPLRSGHETSPLSKRGARLLGLAEGVPIAGPYIDQEAGYMSAVSATSSVLQISMGTAWVGNFVLPKGINGKSPIQLVLPAPVNDGRLAVLPLLTGNASWDWALTSLLNPTIADALRRASRIFREALLPPDGLFCVPWFTQQNALFSGNYGDGRFYGVSAQTNTGDLIRAVAAGMVSELARTFEPLCRASVVDSLVLGGGASKGEFFCQLIAGLFAPLPVYCQQDEDLAAARGALYAFSKDASAAPVRRLPKPHAEQAERITRYHERYRAVFDQSFGFDDRAEPFIVARRKS